MQTGVFSEKTSSILDLKESRGEKVRKFIYFSSKTSALHIKLTLQDIIAIMGRQQRRDQAEDYEEDTAQMKTLAYTIKGWAMEDGVEGRDANETMLAYSAKSTTSVATTINKLQKEGLPDSDIFRNAPTAREKGELEVGLAKYLVVGYALRETDKTLSNAAGKKIRIGGERSPPDYTIKWNEKAIPLLVVTEILEDRPDGIQLWALLKPRNGLCSAFQIAQDQVFYRYEFRDPTTSIRERSSNWNKLVAAQSVRPGINRPLSSKQLLYKKAKDTARVLLPANQSFLNEVLLLVSGFEKVQDPWFLEELKAVLSEADEDLKFTPLPRHTALRKFAEKGEEFCDDDAILLQEELGDTWPEIDKAHCTKESILLLKEAYDTSETLEVIEYRLLRGFLAEGLYVVSKKIQDDDTAELGEAVEAVYSSVQRITPAIKSTAPISTTSENLLVKSVVGKLKEIVSASKEMDSQLKTLCGDVTLDGSPYDIWAYYADAIDTDTAKVAFFSMVRYFLAEDQQRNKQVAGMIADLVEVLEKAGFGDK
jgi:hypothetical protein